MIFLALGLAYANDLPVIKGWTALETESPSVHCAADGRPWCVSEMQVTCDVTKIERFLSDFSQYPKTFPRVISANELEPNMVHVQIDMPFPLYPRDYIAHFRRESIENGVYFWWTSVVHPKAPEREDTVRLPNSAGSWTVTRAGEGYSRIRYFWNAEIGVDIPDWALPRARRTQGQEVMYWLQEACDRSK